MIRARAGMAAFGAGLLAMLAVPEARPARPGEASAVPAPSAAQKRWSWDLPPGFPTPLVPPDNPMTPAKVRLGRRLFHDTRLSREGNFACASCHRPELAFTDGRAQSRGATGELHRRAAPSLANVAYSASLTWADPALRLLEAQALIPMLGEDPVELGLAGVEETVLDRFRDDSEFAGLFADAFPDDPAPVRLDNVVRALASFERTLISGRSPYDRYVYDDDRDALSPAARRGMELFYSNEIGCADCHGGFTFSGPVVFEGAPDIEPTFHNTGLYNLRGEGVYPASDQGLYDVTGEPGDRGKFRAPTLRNVALTAPYFHDGSAATLREVLRTYAAGGRPHDGSLGDGRWNPNKSERLRGFRLATRDEDDLIAFLESLTDASFVRGPRPAGRSDAGPGPAASDPAGER